MKSVLKAILITIKILLQEIKNKISITFINLIKNQFKINKEILFLINKRNNDIIIKNL